MKFEKLTGKNSNEVIQFLTLNSVNDPPNILIFSHEIKRLKNTLWIVKSLLRILIKFESGFILRDKNQIAGVTVCIPPGKEVTNLMLMKSGFFSVPFIMGFKTFKIFMKFIDIASKLKNDYVNNVDHWNIFYFNINPAYKNKGIEKKMLQEFSRISSKDNCPVFIQFFKKELALFLSKSGFKKIAEIKFSADCIMECMIKEPVKKAGKSK